MLIESFQVGDHGGKSGKWVNVTLAAENNQKLGTTYRKFSNKKWSSRLWNREGSDVLDINRFDMTTDQVQNLIQTLNGLASNSVSWNGTSTGNLI